MRVGLNGTAYDAQSSGARERFLNLYGAAARRSPGIEFLLYSPRALCLTPLFEGPAPREVPTPFAPSRPFRRFLRSRAWFARRAAADGLDCFVTDHFPVLGKRTCPTILTVHDLRFLNLPGEGSAFRRFYFRTRFAGVASRARYVVTVSEAIREEVLSSLGLPKDRVHVVPNGVSGRFRPATREEVADFRRRAGWPGEYFLALGVFERRKNLELLLRAWARLGTRDLPPLVLAGRGGPEDSNLRRLTAGLSLSERVLFKGYVPEGDLPAAYSGATALLMPSLYEGFGLPPAQAFACGTPVIASAIPALEEVCGGAALLLDPRGSDDWCDAIRAAAKGASLAGSSREAGFARARSLTWSAAADAFLRVLELP